MTPSFYHCATLRYRPSYLLGEMVNIGVLFWFIDSGKFVFVSPPRLDRLKHLYFDADISNIRRYLTAFEGYAEYLSNNLNKPVFDANLLSDYFLIEDGNTFTFSEWRKGVINDGTIADIVAEDSKKFLLYYNNKQNVTPRNEAFLKNKIKKALSVAPEKKAYFKPKTIETAHIKQEFPFSWQNGTMNVVAPLSFDLKAQRNIQDKAIQYTGLFHHLKGIIADENLKFDLIIARPSNTKLFADYDKALDILQILKQSTPVFETRLSFFEENEIEKYAANALEKVQIN
jgi:Protein of unknown function (DUF3037)